MTQGGAEAKRLWEQLSAKPVLLYSSEYIFDETATLIKQRIGHQNAVEWGETISKSKVVRIWPVTKEIRQESWRLFKLHADKDFSFTDCTSFALIHLFGLRHVLAFDRHFIQMGFLVNRPAG